MEQLATRGSIMFELKGTEAYCIKGLSVSLALTTPPMLRWCCHAKQSKSNHVFAKKKTVQWKSAMTGLALKNSFEFTCDKK